jgi:hypothetical protein
MAAQMPISSDEARLHGLGDSPDGAWQEFPLPKAKQNDEDTSSSDGEEDGGEENGREGKARVRSPKQPWWVGPLGVEGDEPDRREREPPEVGFFDPRLSRGWGDESTGRLSRSLTRLFFEAGGNFAPFACCAQPEHFAPRRGEAVLVEAEYTATTTGTAACFGCMRVSDAFEAMANFRESASAYTRWSFGLVRCAGERQTQNLPKFDIWSIVRLLLSYDAETNLGVLSVTAAGDATPEVVSRTIPPGYVPFVAVRGTGAIVSIRRVYLRNALGSFTKSAGKR